MPRCSGPTEPMVRWIGKYEELSDAEAAGRPRSAQAPTHATSAAKIRIVSFSALLASRGVRVHAVLAGPVDTEMSRDLDVPKAAPASVAQAIFDGVAGGEEEIFPDPLSASLAPGWSAGAVKALERGNAALLGASR